MIHSKIRNQGVFLRRNADSLEATNSLNASAKAALDAPDLPALFGIEGEAAAAYFSCFPEMLNQNNSTSSDGHGPAVMDAVPTILSMSYSTTRTACCGPSAYGRSSVAVSIHTRASCTAATATNQLLLST